MMTLRRILPAAVAITALLSTSLIGYSCSGGEPTIISDLGGSEVVGKLLDTDEEPVQNARVVLNATTTDSNSLSVVPMDTVFTDHEGTFLFDSVASDTYNVYGDYNDGELVVLIRSVSHDTGRTDIGAHTMYAPGRISGIVSPEHADSREGVFCYVPGTSFLAITRSDGSFVIHNVPPGTHILACQLPGYFTSRDTLVVESEKTTSVGTVLLKTDTTLPPPPPTGLTAVYDTLSGTTRLSWNRVYGSDLVMYQVFMDTDSTAPGPVSITRVLDTSFVHVVFPDRSDTNSYRIPYLVRSVLNSRYGTAYSDPVTIHAASPTLVQTDFSWSTFSDGPLRALDEINVRLAYSNPTRKCSLLTWTVEGTQVQRKPLNAFAGADTFTYVWSDTGTKHIYAQIIDAAGTVWQDSITLLLNEKAVILPRDKWEPAPSMLQGRRFGASTLLGNKMYVAGGEFDQFDITGPSPVATAEFEVYDFSRRTWQLLNPMQDALFAHTLSAANGRLYVIGGRNYHQTFRQVKEYDPVQRHWRLVSGMPYSLAGHAAVTFNGDIYVIGGITSSTEGPRIQSLVSRFDPATGAWDSVGTLTTPRAYHQAIADGQSIYVLGGWGGDSLTNSARVLASAEIFDIYAQKSDLTRPMSDPRINFGAGLINEKIIVMGGLQSTRTNTVLNSVEEFDVRTETWCAKTDMTKARHGMTSESHAGGIYVMGGTHGQYPVSDEPMGETDTVEVFYP